MFWCLLLLPLLLYVGKVRAPNYGRFLIADVVFLSSFPTNGELQINHLVRTSQTRVRVGANNA